MDIFKDLNEQQRKAVEQINGPLLVIAGAGAGKTKVITHRIANLIQNGVKPEQILAVTFTNKAAGEMKERIKKLLTNNQKQITRTPTIGTFHSICARILRENARAINRPRTFSIFDKEDSLKTIKKSLKDLELDPKQFQPAKIMAIISRQKSDLITCDRFMESASIDFFPKTVATIWQEYEKNMEKQRALDFDDLISKTAHLLENNKEILEKYQNKWQYILIDEYQDTNHAQYALSKLLAQKHKNICVVGDEDQSIYKFRGANFGNILRFEKDWLDTKVVLLEQNYRSSQKILEAANAVIKRNSQRKNKNLFSELDQGKKLTLTDAMSEKDEADFIASSANDLIYNGAAKPSDIAVLYRANFQSRALEEAFLYHEIPYQVVGTKFFDRKEVKDIICYLKAALNPDDYISFERIINEPARGIGKATLLSHFSGKKLTSDKEVKIKDFFNLMEKIKETSETKKLSETLGFIIEKTGYKKYLGDGSEENMARLDNLKELTALATKYDNFEPRIAVETFLEETALLSAQDEIEDENEETKGKVRLMTVHAAKGLEFPYVFISGLEEGLFPFKRFDSPADDEEEERRLFYVALTRAKEKVYLTFAYSRIFFGGKQTNRPSKFLKEIPEELLDGVDEIPTTNYLEI